MISDNINYADTMAKREYTQALHKAFWGKIRRLFGHQCQDLLSGEKILGRIKINETRDLGQMQVPTDRIVGSSGRNQDFDLNFLPRRQEQDGRWLSIARARHQGINLPLPRLYKVGDAFFVEDGNHRVSVARARGEDTIEAQVIEIISSDLQANPSCTRLGYKLKETAGN